MAKTSHIFPPLTLIMLCEIISDSPLFLDKNVEGALPCAFTGVLFSRPRVWTYSASHSPLQALLNFIPNHTKGTVVQFPLWSSPYPSFFSWRLRPSGCPPPSSSAYMVSYPAPYHPSDQQFMNLCLGGVVSPQMGLLVIRSFCCSGWLQDWVPMGSSLACFLDFRFKSYLLPLQISPLSPF